MTSPADNTPNAIIADAMELAGLLQEGEQPNGEQFVKYSRRLRDVIKVEQTQGIKLFLNVDTVVPLVLGQGLYHLTPGGDVDMTKPLRVINAYFADVNGIRRPLVPLAWSDYVRLSQINQLGVINSYFVDKQATSLNVFFWLLPDSSQITGTAHVILQVAITSFTTLTETMSFPDEWRMFLVWALADEISTGQPQAIMDRCAMKAQQYRQMLEDWDVEDVATQFQPDARSQYVSNSFR